MVTPLQFDNWQWLSLALASPVVVWGGLPFHRAAWVNLRHGAATMDTLISLGTLAAFGWSLYALFLGDAGMPGMRMDFVLIPTEGASSSEIYLETAAIVTTFLLAGRWFEATRSAARARRSAPCWSWEPRKRPSSMTDGTRAPRPRSRSSPSATASSSARARRSPPTASSRRAPRRST